MFELEKVDYKNGYSMVPNEVFRDEHLDPFSIGVLSCILQCDPKSWTLSPQSIAGVMCCGESSVIKAFKRLEASGHLERVDMRTSKGYKVKSSYKVHPISTGIDYYHKRTGINLMEGDHKYQRNQLKREELECKKRLR